MSRTVFALVVPLPLLIACHSDRASSSGSSGSPLAAGVSLGSPVAAGGLHFAAPAGWKEEGPRPMRVATFAVPAAKGDPEDGECAVFFFGAGQGGSVDANLERWLGQFTRPDGQPVAGWERRETRKAGALTVTQVDVSGTYLFSPAPMSPEKTPKPGYRMLGAIVEGGEGVVFFKLTAPAATAAANQGGFEAMLGSLSHS